jgi:hypothetical protein
MECHQAGPFVHRLVQGRDIAETHQWFGIALHAIKIQMGQHAQATKASSGTNNRIHLIVIDHLFKLIRPLVIGSGQVTALNEYALVNPGFKTHLMQNPDTAVKELSVE